MAQTTPLDIVIKRVEVNESTPPGRKRIVIDCKTGKSVAEPRWFGDYRYFQVSSTSAQSKGYPLSVAECVSPILSIKDELQRTIGVRLSYQAECAAGDEEKLAESLYHEMHPSLALDKKVESWVNEFIGRPRSAFLENYYEKKDELAKHLLQRGKAEGITLSELAIWIENEREAVKPIPVTFDSLLVGFNDSPEELPLRFVGKLFVSENGKINAIGYYHRRGELLQQVEEELKSYFVSQVSHEEYSSQLDDLSEKIRKHLNQRLNSWGRQFPVIFLRTDEDGGYSFYPAEKEVEVTIDDYPVTIKSKVHLLRRDIARYKAKGSPDLDKWVEEQLSTAIEWETLKIKYVDLLLELPTIEQKIRDRLSREAAKIGYVLELLMTFPQLRQSEWLVEINISDIKEEVFETRISGVEVKLTIPVKAKLRDFTKVIDQIHSDVPALMREAIVEEVKSFIDTLHPERFYMRFDHPSLEGEKSEKPVASEIAELISNTLDKKFNAVTISVIPKMGKTDILERLRRLKRKPGSFVAELKPRGDQVVPYIGGFSVDSVTDWYAFEHQDIELDHIEDHIAKSLKLSTSLSNRSIRELAPSDELSQERLNEEIRRIAEKAVVDRYGLLIRLDLLNREDIGTEKDDEEIRALLRKKRIEVIRKSIEKLADAEILTQSKLVDAIMTEDDTNEVSKMRKSLTSVREELSELIGQRDRLLAGSKENLPLSPENGAVEDTEASSTGGSND